MVLNSIQAIPDLNGKVDIRVETRDKDLVISIADNGKGIAKEHLSRVFDSSFTHGKLKGTGLGLAYCKHVVEAHGGTITVQSEEGKGATFEIIISSAVEKEIPVNIPIIEEPVQTQKTAQPTPVAVGNFQWIIVEDTEEFRKQWKEIFIKNKLPPPIEFILPELAVSANIDWKKVGGAIVDLNYEGSVMDGLDLIQWLIPKGLKTIHLCTSDHSEEKVQREAKRLNITSVIPKPIPDDIDDPKSGIFHLS